MQRKIDIPDLSVILFSLLFGIFLIQPVLTAAQEEVASSIRRYKEYEASSGYYEEYEVLPKRMQPFVGIRSVRHDVLSYSDTASGVRNRQFLADSHLGIKFYSVQRCQKCHVDATKDFHTVRGNITCRQCHGGEPIASINHYYSPLHPIRRHAYVCAKCHEGASASYAEYIVHVPNPSQTGTLESFPFLFYAFWIMIGIAFMTFVVFLPHTILWGIRELFIKKRGGEK